MAIENVELKHECFPEHLCMGISRIKYDKGTEKECKNIRVNIEVNTACTKKKGSPDGLTGARASLLHGVATPRS